MAFDVDMTGYCAWWNDWPWYDDVMASDVCMLISYSSTIVPPPR